MEEEFDLEEHRKSVRLGCFHSFATMITNIQMISHSLSFVACQEERYDIHNECAEIQNICRKLHEIIRKDLL